MSNSIFKVVYCSRNLISGDAAERDAEIQQILETARRNNHAAEITGALLFSAGHFAQVLEGPRESIEGVFERIQRDQRHSEVTVLEHLPAGRRDFGEWSMAYVAAESRPMPSDIDTKLKGAIEHTSAAGQQVLELLKSLMLPED